jgi:hypothetical protein
VDPRFSHPTYLLRKKVFKILGGVFRVFDPAGNLVFFVHQRVKLREDIRVYGDEAKQQELLTIAARMVIDFSAAYDITDALSGEKVGALRRKGMKSILRDEWLILDAAENQIGMIQEESMSTALIRRFVPVGGLLPQTFYLTIGEAQVARFHQRFNPFVPQIELDFTPDTGFALDRRLGIAAAVLLAAIEGRQG